MLNDVVRYPRYRFPFAIISYAMMWFATSSRLDGSASHRPSATSAHACVRDVERRDGGLTRSTPRQRPTCAVVVVNLTVPEGGGSC